MLLKSLPLLFALLFGALASNDARAGSGELVVRIVDGESKEPIAVRLVIRSADGDHPGDRIGLGSDKWPGLAAHGVFISGEGAFTLPPGKTIVTASCGPQYRIERREVEIVPGKKMTIDFVLERHIDLRKLGWVCGDAHLHMIHGEMQRETSYAEIAITCRAGGLDWAYVNQEYGGAGELDFDGLHAECRKVSYENFQLLLGAERPKSLLGHHALIGVANPFVVPDDPPYHRAAKSIHDQGGVYFPVHPLRYYPGKQYADQWLDFPGNNLARELVFDAFLGPSFDGLSVLSDEPNNPLAYQLWFNLLNKGLFVPALADCDACFDRPTLGRNTPGFWQTYVYVGPPGTIDNASLAGAVRCGRTMATTGPLLLWDIDKERSGSTLPLDGKPREISIDVLHGHHNWTLEDARISKVELIRNGELARVWEPSTPDAKLSFIVRESEPCWYAVRAFGSDPRWQVAVGSPIHFAETPRVAKREPLTVRVRGRVYDFVTGEERPAQITISRGDEKLKEFSTEGQFAVDMPLDATVSATTEGGATISHDLLLDYAPVHRFLWNLDSEALGRPETLDQFESLVRNVDLEFPIGYRMPCCYQATDLVKDTKIDAIKVIEGPKASAGAVEVATILLDKAQAKAGDVINAAVLFHAGDGQGAGEELLVVEGRGYDPRRPSGFNPLKAFGSFEAKWSQAADAGHGYRYIAGALTIPDWVDAGSVNSVEINAFARRRDGGYDSHVGLRLPLGVTSRALMVASNWPTVPISWPDHNYGIGPLKICGKLGREGQPQADYRALRMTLTAGGEFEVDPKRDCRGCPDAEDAVFTGQFFDQILNEESHLADSPRAD